LLRHCYCSLPAFVLISSIACITAVAGCWDVAGVLAVGACLHFLSFLLLPPLLFSVVMLLIFKLLLATQFRMAFLL
jgi:hypothetical protein